MILVKQKNYELVLPTHYVDVDQDEMEYVNGKGWLSRSCAFGFGVAVGIATAIERLRLVL